MLYSLQSSRLRSLLRHKARASTAVVDMPWWSECTDLPCRPTAIPALPAALASRLATMTLTYFEQTVYHAAGQLRFRGMPAGSFGDPAQLRMPTARKPPESPARASLPMKMQGNLLSYEMSKEVAKPCVMSKSLPNLRPAHKPRTG